MGDYRSRNVVIGIGNELRRDDAVGPAVVTRLRADGEALRLAGCDLHVSDGEPGRLLTLWEGAPLAVVVDAARTRRPTPGRVHLLVADDVDLTVLGPVSSHGLGLAGAVSLARGLGRLPGRLIVYAVEVADTGPGSGLSAPVAQAAAYVAGRVRDDLASAAVVTRA